MRNDMLIVEENNEKDELKTIEKVQYALKEYIICNSKCKVPWTYKELEQAKQFAQDYIDKYEAYNM